MKTFILKTLSYLMVGVVFMSSTGFGLVEHSCLMSGKKERMLMSEKSCCTQKTVTLASHHPKKTAQKKSECCQVEKEYSNVDFSTSTSIVQVFSKLLVDLSVAVLHVFSFLFNLLVEAFQSTVQMAFPPPLSGRELLTLLHLLRI
jgi:hypothetical protein